MQVTFEEYDKIMERFDKMSAETYWPSLSNIEIFKSDPKKWMLFCIYLYEKGKEPQNNQEKYSKRNLGNFINQNLEIKG